MIDDDLAAYGGWLHATAGRLIGFKHEAFDDVVQEGRIAMWLNPQWPTQAALERMKEVRQGRAWFGQPSRRNGGHGRTAVGLWEREALVEPLSDDHDLPARWVDPTTELAVRDAVSKLDDREREYVFRRYWKGESASDLAATFGSSANDRRAGLRGRAEHQLAEQLAA